MPELLTLLVEPTLQTVYMTIASTGIALLLGLPLGVCLVLLRPEGIHENDTAFRLLDGGVNVMRSVPFIILMILLFPLSRVIVGTTIGTTASIIPLAIAASPFMGRVIEGALLEVARKLIEAVESMGATTMDIVVKVMIPEALPSLLLGITLTVINIIGYSAMAGAIGGGGLGDLAIRYGFHRFQTDVLISAVVVIVLLVQSVQALGNRAAAYISRNR